MEEGSIQDNMQKGRGIVKKEPFTVVGLDKSDRDTSGHQDLQKGPGRPPVDKTWTQVGPSVEKEGGQGA